jgi:putative sugar O-methyltransferase
MTEADVAACRALVAEIDTLACATGAYDAQEQWTNPAGSAVYGRRPFDPAQINAEFIADLPRRAFFFTGWVSNGGDTLNPIGRALWRLLKWQSAPAAAKLLALLTSRFGGALNAPPAEILQDLFEHFATGLPAEYVCTADFDGTAFDRVAVQERMAALYRSGLLQPLRGTAPRILEIGAGYGALALAVRRVLPDAIYTIVDLPQSLCLAACYLATRQDCLVTVDPAKADSSGSILLVPCNALHRLDARTDLAINTLSFGEMPEAVVEDYAKFLRRCAKPGALLFEQNFDNSHIGRPNFCNPEVALGRHLQQLRVVGGVYLKGRPRVWSMLTS